MTAKLKPDPRDVENVVVNCYSNPHQFDEHAKRFRGAFINDYDTKGSQFGHDNVEIYLMTNGQFALVRKWKPGVGYCGEGSVVWYLPTREEVIETMRKDGAERGDITSFNHLLNEATQSASYNRMLTQIARALARNLRENQ